MHVVSLTLFYLLLRPSLTLDCSIAPPFHGLVSSPKGTGLRIGRKASILFTPLFNTSLVKVRFGMRAKESSLLFKVKLQKSKTKYYLSTNHSLSSFVDHLAVHQECIRPFLELVIIPRCGFSKKIYFMPNSGGEIQYEIISYDIMNPTIFKFGKTLVLSTEINECRTIDLRTRGYFISHSFPVFYFPNNSVRVPARIVSEINKTKVIYMITYQINNETILDNNVTPSAITIAYETSQKAFGIHFELSQIAHTLGISWMPSGQLQEKGSLLRFRYTILRNESLGLTALEVHLSRRMTAAGQQSLLMRVMPLPRGAAYIWQGFRLPPAHLAFHALHHMTSSAEGDLQTLEVGLVPDDSCRVPMVFQVLAISAKGRQWRQASAYFESFSLLSFELWREPQKQEGNVRLKVGFCSPNLPDRAPPKIRWRFEGLYSNWTTLATQSQRLDEFSLLLTMAFSVLLRCEVQNLSLAVADSKAFIQVVLDEVLPDNFCEANVRWSVMTADGGQLQDLTWIRKQEPFFLRLHAHFPKFFSVDAFIEVNIPRQELLTFQRSRFKSDGEVLRLQQQWRQQLNDCHLFADTFQAQIVDRGQTIALAKMAILPQFCQPQITEFKVLSQSTNGGQLTISCRIETSLPLYGASSDILDNGKSMKDLVLKRKGTVLMMDAAINFSSCEDLQLRVVVCLFRQKNMPVVFRPLLAQGAFCEGPMLYFLFLVCGVLPIVGFQYLIIALRRCFLKGRQRI